MEKTKMKVYSAHGLAGGWRTVLDDGDGCKIKWMSRIERVEFTKWWGVVGCHGFAQWLVERDRAYAYENKDGDLVVVFATKKNIIVENRKRKGN